MDWRISGRVAVVTGAGGGIGRAISVSLATAGVKVVATDLSESSLSRLSDEIRSAGGEIKTVAGDISGVPFIDQVFAIAQVQFGVADILVNVAGINTTTSILDYTEENWDHHFAVNLKAAAFASAAAARQMIPRGSGKIINIASTSGFVASTNPKSAYDSSKAALRHLTVSLGKELASKGILVNGVAPGTITTEMTRTWLQSPEGLAKSLSRIPLGRIGDASDVADAVLFLASPYSNYIVGHTIVVDGGWIL